jgi:hypothetical protein
MNKYYLPVRIVFAKKDAIVLLLLRVEVVLIRKEEIIMMSNNNNKKEIEHLGFCVCAYCSDSGPIPPSSIGRSRKYELSVQVRALLWKLPVLLAPPPIRLKTG